MLINKNTNDNYTVRQLKLPLEIEKLIDISDPVYTFCEVMDHILTILTFNKFTTCDTEKVYHLIVKEFTTLILIKENTLEHSPYVITLYKRHLPITGEFPILDDIFGRFGIWIFVATLLAVYSNTPLHAALRVFSFFFTMILTYYAYTILFLGFFPKSQII